MNKKYIIILHHTQAKNISITCLKTNINGCLFHISDYKIYGSVCIRLFKMDVNFASMRRFVVGDQLKFGSSGRCTGAARAPEF